MIESNFRTYLSESSSLVGANDRDSAQGLDSLQRLAEHFVLAHDVRGNGQAGRDSNRQTLGNESNGDTDTADDQDWNRDPVGMVLAKPGTPEIKLAKGSDTDSSRDCGTYQQIKTIATMTNMTEQIKMTKRSTSFSKVVKPVCGVFVKLAILPKTVRSPVATTRPRQLPETQ